MKCITLWLFPSTDMTRGRSYGELFIQCMHQWKRYTLTPFCIATYITIGLKNVNFLAVALTLNPPLWRNKILDLYHKLCSCFLTKMLDLVWDKLLSFHGFQFTPLMRSHVFSNPRYADLPVISNLSLSLGVDLHQCIAVIISWASLTSGSQTISIYWSPC